MVLMAFKNRFAKWLAGLAVALGVAAAAQGPLETVLTPQVAAPAASTPPVNAAPSGAPALTKRDVDAWLDGYLPYALHSGDIPGAVVTVVKDGQVLTARGYGYANLDKKTPIDPNLTLFRPGSISKLITWTAVMQQVERGKIDLDRDVNSYLDFRIPLRDGKPITLREIMTHTAGFEEQAKDISFFDPNNVRPLGDYLKAWVPKRIFAPGTTPAYSNYATALAGYIVQRVSGQPFDDYVEANIFRPLDMKTATFRQPLPAALAGQASEGYPKPGEPASKYELIGPAPAGSMAASGLDMAKFMLSHLEEGRGIMRPETARLMHHSPVSGLSPLATIPPLNRMALGFFETNVNGREVIAHLGDLQAFHSSLHLFMADNVGIYYSFNSGGKAGASGTLRAALFHDFADRYFPGPMPDGHVDAKTSAEHARMMTGVWQNSRRSDSNFLKALGLMSQAKVSVGPKGELLVPSLTGTNGRPREWVEIASFVWRDKYGPDRLAAKVVDGQVVRWSMDMMSPFMVFERVPAGLSNAWILPALYTSLAVLLLTFLYWPGSWYVRRRYQASLGVEGHGRRAYRATRLMALLVLLVLVGWMVAVSVMFADLSKLTAGFDPVLWLLQIAGAVVFVGAVGIAGWNLWVTVRNGRRWTRVTWNVLILLATLMVLYVAIRFNLIAMTVHY